MSSINRSDRYDISNQGFDKTPAYLLLHSANGTAYYVFAEDDGTLRVHNAVPTANTDGSVVGDQTD